MTILDEIADSTQARVSGQKAAVPMDEMRRRADDTVRPDRFPFERSLRVEELSFIAEVKKASPSAGVIAADFPYMEIATEYEQAGAAAISVLTEPHFFQGSDEYLARIAATSSIPVLRKDFVVDEYQIVQARALGASAVLLIVALLDDVKLRSFLALADELGLSALVEVHDQVECRRALAAGARVVGVNNRDLHTFQVDPGTTERLASLVPPDVLLVAESGVSEPATVRRLRDAGIDAILVGEALMRSSDKTTALRQLRSNLRQIKICGLTTADDVNAVNAAPPDFAGFVFAEESSRRVTLSKAAELRGMLRPSIAVVGVFVDAEPAMIAELAAAGVIELVQMHGHETDTDVATIKERTGLPVLKGVRMNDGGRTDFPSADHIILDSTAGSGHVFDWKNIPPLGRPFFLAGGITTGNLATALAVPGVIGVDISSGAERGGHKNPALVTELVSATRAFGMTNLRRH